MMKTDRMPSAFGSCGGLSGVRSTLAFRRTAASLIAAIFFLSAVSFSGFLSGGIAEEQDAPSGFVLVKIILVAGNAAVTDTGLDVQKDEAYFFSAEGTVSLQRDNPVATCGPEGLGLRTMQQPLPDQNLGALIGKIRERIEVSEDGQTGEKTQRDVGRYFFVGKSKMVAELPAGHLLLGINENVCGDNEGSFEVKIYQKRAG